MLLFSVFQYNCISLGFTVAAVAAILSGKDLFGSVLYCLALNHKQVNPLCHCIGLFCCSFFLISSSYSTWSNESSSYSIWFMEYRQILYVLINYNLIICGHLLVLFVVLSVKLESKLDVFFLVNSYSLLIISPSKRYPDILLRLYACFNQTQFLYLLPDQFDDFLLLSYE